MIEIVADTNIMFSFFWEKSITRKIMHSNFLKIYSSEFAITEILKYKQEIIEKTKITNKEFIKKLNELKKTILFISKKEYSHLLKYTENKIKDKNDLDFLTLAYFLKMPLWSNDKGFEIQSIVPIITTKDIVIMFKKN